MKNFACSSRSKHKRRSTTSKRSPRSMESMACSLVRPIFTHRSAMPVRLPIQQVKPIIDDGIRRIRNAGKAPGILTADEAMPGSWLELGCQFVAVGADTGILARESEETRAKFKAGGEGARNPMNRTTEQSAQIETVPLWIGGKRVYPQKHADRRRHQSGHRRSDSPGSLWSTRLISIERLRRLGHSVSTVARYTAVATGTSDAEVSRAAAGEY